MSEHKLLSDAELRRQINGCTMELELKVRSVCALRVMAHIAAQAAEIERLRADGERSGILKFVRELTCAEHTGDVAGTVLRFLPQLGIETRANRYDEDWAERVRDAIDNARANEGR